MIGLSGFIRAPDHSIAMVKYSLDFNDLSMLINELVCGIGWLTNYILLRERPEFMGGGLEILPNQHLNFNAVPPSGP